MTDPGDAPGIATAPRWTVSKPSCDSDFITARPARRFGTSVSVTTEALPQDSASTPGPAAADYVAVVAAVGNGDAAALAQLYDATVSKVHALVRAMVANADDAEEVTCDVYTYAWQTAAQFDPARGPVLNWLLTIARSRSLDALRRARTRGRLIEEDVVTEDIADHKPSAAPDYYLNLFQSGSAVQTAMAQLSPDRRQLIGLAFFEDLSHSEIAVRTGLPIGTVKSHLRRALHTMRGSLYAREHE